MKNIICISDTHFGGSTALAQQHLLDDGGGYVPSPLQDKLRGLWEDFWKWSYDLTRGQPFTLVHNGDIVDGSHHGTTALNSGNLTIQQRLAYEMMLPHVERSEAYYQIRGTEAHVGQSASLEEGVADALGAERDENGRAARWELWLKADGELIHFAHHIGNTGSTAYESSAMMREITAMYEDAAMWDRKPATIIVRGHTHRFIRVSHVHCTGIKLPAWQAKTPFAYKIDRLRAPMFGGIVIRTREGEAASIAEKIYTIKQTESVTI